MALKQLIKVSIPVGSDTSASTLYGLHDVLSVVGVSWHKVVSGAPVEPWFEVRIVAAEGSTVRGANGVRISPHCRFDEAEDTDIVVVPSRIMSAATQPKFQDKREFDWIRFQESRGAVIASSCTGAILLAEAGLLDGWEATTHWAYRDLFRVHYPEVRMRIEQDLCVSGPENRIVTSGGATAWQELALYLITRFCGMEQAVRTAKLALIPRREESQATFDTMSKGIPHDDGVVNECQEWIAINYKNSSPVAAMIEWSGLPSTTFARRFKRATGYRPIDYVHALRVEEAKEMLEVSGDGIDEIGREVGYEDPSSFRRIFKRKVGLAPSVYRRSLGRSRFERFEKMHK